MLLLGICVGRGCFFGGDMNVPKTLRDLVNIIEYNDKVQDRDNAVVLIVYKNEASDLLDDLKKHLSIMDNFYIKYT
jgi:hypothetical protein